MTNWDITRNDSYAVVWKNFKTKRIISVERQADYESTKKWRVLTGIENGYATWLSEGLSRSGAKSFARKYMRAN